MFALVSTNISILAKDFDNLDVDLKEYFKVFNNGRRGN
jgi:hypothetical protein